MLERQKCPDCGTIPDEWLDSEGKAQEPPPYKVETLRCLGCEARHDEEEMIPPKRRKGIHFFFRRWREDDDQS